MTKSSSSIELYQGESRDLELELVRCVVQVDGSEIEQPLELNGAKICFTVRKSVGDPTVKIVKTSDNVAEIEILSPPEDGKALIYILAEDTALLEPGKYVFDIWVILVSGKKVPVIEPADFLIKEPVTKAC